MREGERVAAAEEREGEDDGGDDLLREPTEATVHARAPAVANRLPYGALTKKARGTCTPRAPPKPRPRGSDPSVRRGRRRARGLGADRGNAPTQTRSSRDIANRARVSSEIRPGRLREGIQNLATVYGLPTPSPATLPSPHDSLIFLSSCLVMNAASSSFSSPGRTS